MKETKSRDGTVISYVEAGQGPLLILVGGALQTKSDRLMRALSSALANEFRVVSYDRRGRGGSGNTEPYAVDREVEDLEAVMAAVGPPAGVFGNSSGAHLALLAASKLSAIPKLALYEAPFIPESRPGDAEDYLRALRACLAERPDRALKLFLGRVGVPRPVLFVMGLLPLWRELKALAPTLVNDALLVGDGQAPAHLRLVKVPVLAITGSSPRMQQAAESLTRALPHGQRLSLEGQTHNVSPAILAPALRAFFRNGDARPADR